MEAAAKIIVVDDEKRICHNVEKILSKNNFEVTHALSAQDAMEKMAKERDNPRATYKRARKGVTSLSVTMARGMVMTRSPTFSNLLRSGMTI